MSFEPAPPVVCAAIELALNSYLKLDPQAFKPMHAHSDRVLCLQLKQLNWKLFLLPTQSGFLVLGDYQGQADASITATPWALTQLGLADDRQTALRQLDVRIDGSAQLAQSFSDVLGDVRLDWEEALAKVMGDLAAHRIGGGIRQGVAKKREQLNNGKDTLLEYLQEEARILPTRLEVEYLGQRIDRFRERLDRLEARIKRRERA